MIKKIYLLFAVIISLAGPECSKETLSSNAYGGAGSGQGGSLARFTIVGNYLYTVDKEKLKVFSLTDPAQPVLKNTIDVGFEIETIFPFKDKLFIGSTSVVHIFSIEKPDKPQQLSTAISPQVMRRCDPVVAKDTVAYATLRTNGPCGGTQSILAIYDIKNVTNPVQRATYSLGEPYGLGYSDTALYVCDHFNGLMLFNIRDAYQPEFVNALFDGTYLDVIPYGNTLICWVTDGVILYDISDRLMPKFIAKIT